MFHIKIDRICLYFFAESIFYWSRHIFHVCYLYLLVFFLHLKVEWYWINLLSTHVRRTTIQIKTNFIKSVTSLGFKSFLWKKKCRKIKVVRSLRYSGYLTNTSCVCQVAVISKRSNDKQKSFIPKKKIWKLWLFSCSDINLVTLLKFKYQSAEKWRQIWIS